MQNKISGQDPFAKAFEILSQFEEKSRPFDLLYKGFPVWIGIRQYIYMHIVQSLDARIVSGSGSIFLKPQDFSLYAKLLLSKLKFLNRSLIFNKRLMKNKVLLFSDIISRRALIDGESVDIFIDPIRLEDASSQITGIETISLGNSLRAKDKFYTLRAYDLLLLQGVSSIYEKIALDILKRPPDTSKMNLNNIEANLYDICLEQELFRRILYNFIFYFDFISKYWENIFIKTQPQFVAGTNWCARANIIKYFVANKMSIPTAEIMHGIINKHNPEYIFRNLDRDNRASLAFPKYLIVFGKFFKDLLNREGSLWKEDKIFDLGYPWLDYSVNNAQFDKGRIRERLGIKNGVKILSITSQRTIQVILKEMLQALIIPDDWFVVIKLHPGEVVFAKKAYQGLFDNPRLKFISDSDASFYELLSISQAHAGFYSMSLWEAGAFGVANYIIDYSTKDNIKDVEALGLARVSSLQNIFKDQYVPNKKTLGYVFSNLNGDSAKSYLDFFKTRYN